MFKKVLNIFIIGFILCNTALGKSHEYIGSDKINPIIEITDRFGEAKLGLTNNSIYLIVSEELKEKVNSDFQNQHNADLHTFDDSEGNFIPSKLITLSSNKIEFNISQIKNINFENGQFEIDHYNSTSLSFSNIKATNGYNVLDNFYLEDLESLFLAYRNLIDQNK